MVMPGNLRLPTVDELVSDLRVLRERGLVRLRHSDLPSLRAAATRIGLVANLATPGTVSEVAVAGQDPGQGSDGSGVEAVLRAAVQNLGDSELGKAALATFGLDRGTRDRPAQDRRRRAALIYGISIERFRKHHERIVLEQVGEEILKLALQSQLRSQSQAAAEPVPARSAPSARTALSGRVAGLDLRVVVHVQPVELLAGVDIVVVPTNSYLELPQSYKSSVSAVIRRMAAVKNADGQVAIDVVADELTSWLSKNARPGLPVAPGTVAPTSSGEMLRQGMRRFYHVAIVSPRPWSNEYEVEPSAIAAGVRNIFEVGRIERSLFSPPLRSMAFPLLGAGRGGLDPATSFEWLWSALTQQLRSEDFWEIHFFSRLQAQAEIMIARLAADGLAVGDGR
jgi:hypothetical protein